MKKISYRLVYNRKKRLNASGKALIQIEAYLTKRKIYFSTHIYVRPEQWDIRRARIIHHPHEEELNRMLDEFLLRLQYKELEGWKQGKTISLSMLKLDDSDDSYCNFFTFGRKWVECSVKKASTKNNLKTTLTLLHEFRPSICLAEIDYQLLLQFEAFLKQKDLKVNTIAKHLCHFRTFYNEAIREGLVSPTSSPFINYKIKTTEGKHVFLLPAELERLEMLASELSGGPLSHTLDAFLFCCYTGLRYSDFTKLSEENLIYPDHQHVWLVFKSQKTGVESQIPLDLLFQGKAVQILEKYEDKARFFRLKPNPDINKELIRIGRLAHIEKHFSFHSSRHIINSYILKMTNLQDLFFRQVTV